MDICNYLHKNATSTFIFIISALGSEEQKIKAFEMGADSYINKPFSPKVLASEIMALFRRCNTHKQMIDKSEITLDEDYFQVNINGHTLQLTPGEFLIFSTLFENKHMPFSRFDLVTLIYESGQGEISERGIDSHIAHIRKKLEPYKYKELIETVRGKGYVINGH